METASAFIDEKIKQLVDWRGKTLAKVRDIIHQADPEIVRRMEVGDSRLVPRRHRYPRRRQGRCGGLEGSHPRCSGAQSQGQKQAEAPASEQQAGLLVPSHL